MVTFDTNYIAGRVVSAVGVVVKENAINLLIRQIQIQCPSLLNYGTIDMAKNPDSWCYN